MTITRCFILENRVIRKFSNSVRASSNESRELVELTTKVPFDDRTNHHASLHDIRIPLIKSYLNEVGSALLEESSTIPVIDLCRQMAIVEGGNEYLKPRNVGLLFFNDQPEKFFPYAQIEVVYFPDDEGGDTIQEEIFKGPLDHQLRTALRHIQNSFISERILKIPDQAEAIRFFNYPYLAIEEALVNTVYHRGYDVREPIVVRINRSSITIVSHPGPDPFVTLEDIHKGQMVSQRYRNRRIGEFLKELDFTEGRGTGLPKIKRALKINGSPDPTFFTDPERLSFRTVIPIHPEFLNERVPAITQEAPDQASDQALDQPLLNETELKLLQLCSDKPVNRKDILTKFGHKTMSGNIKQALKRLKALDFIALTIEDKPNSKNQHYRITETGKNKVKFMHHSQLLFKKQRNSKR